jgi:hypothetical protein
MSCNVTILHLLSIINHLFKYSKMNTSIITPANHQSLISFDALTIGSKVQVKRLFYNEKYPNGKPLDYTGVIIALGSDHETDLNVGVGLDNNVVMYFNRSELFIISLK